MIAPLKLPPPPRLAILGPQRTRPKFQDDDDEGATMLWKGRGRSESSLLGGGFAAEDTAPFVFQAEVGEEDSTFISKPNLKDPRLLRSDRPPALLTSLPDEPTRVINAAHESPPVATALHLPPPVESAPLPGRQMPDEPAVWSGEMPADWEETPSPVIVIRAARPKSSRALWAAVVGVAAVAAGLSVASNPERSAAFVDRVVAGGTALVASVR